MAEFRGFRCDKCDEVIPTDQRTRRTIRFDGVEVSKECHLDLCWGCVEVELDALEDQGVDMKPIPRRNRASSGVSHDNQTVEQVPS